MKRYLALFSIIFIAVLFGAVTVNAGKPDKTAPVTTATPAGGTYTGSVTVTLTANEPAATYYCIGSGCTPTTVYSSALTFTATTTLRYYSRDTAGNTEPVKEQVYTIGSQACTPEPTLSQHAGLLWNGSYTICQQCHSSGANEVLSSTHYQWKGSASKMVNGQPQQGKIVQRDGSGAILTGTSSMNAYCVNILGNWGGCGSCHVGIGAEPTSTNSDNIDCFMCHQRHYKRKKVSGVFQPDTASMCIDMNTAVQTVHKPKRDNCIQCHGFGGGGDNYKRGDLAGAHKSTTDASFDTHMATSGANLVCQNCHTTTQHRIAGRGSDLRPSDSSAAINCSTASCHPTKMNSNGHTTAYVNFHVRKVACQTCHIPQYAKNASDTAATEATETHRDWTLPEWNAAKSRWEPTPTRANNLMPKYLHWNGTSWGYNLKDPAVFDAATGAYPLSRPQGGINDVSSKFFPFKYKTARQPYAASLNVLIAIDTAKYWGMPASPYVPTQADIDATVAAGLTNMGYSSTTPFFWVTTDEYQLITHEVPPATAVLQCASCHPDASATQIKLATNHGYKMKSGWTKAQICSQCHSDKKMPDYERLHNNHVHSTRNRDCSWCHDFSRAEEGYCAYPGPCN